ncbi:MAG: hypothetical protein WAO19_10085 [Candidatus Kryptoniota bacterium]
MINLSYSSFGNKKRHAYQIFLCSCIVISIYSSGQFHRISFIDAEKSAKEVAAKLNHDTSLIEPNDSSRKTFSFYYDLQRTKYPSRIEGYDIIKTHDVDSTEGAGIFSLVISRNDSIKFRTGIGVDDSNYVTYVLFPLLPNGRKQVIVEEYTGGAHCCRMYWILDLADTVTVLYHSDETETEVGFISEVADFDNDGFYEFTQGLNSFHYFENLGGPGSPWPLAVLKFSVDKRCFVLANRDFPAIVLRDIEDKESEVQELLDTTKVFDYDASSDLLSETLDVLLRYVYVGQDSIGWAYFNKNYVLSDSLKMRKKIQDVLETSTVYKQLYHR